MNNVWGGAPGAPPYSVCALRLRQGGSTVRTPNLQTPKRGSSRLVYTRPPQLLYNFFTSFWYTMLDSLPDTFCQTR